MPEASRYPKYPISEVTDLEAAIRQLRQIGCILDSCTISASYEVSQAQKSILLMPRTAKGASTSSEELNAQISPHNLPAHEDYWGSTRVPELTANPGSSPSEPFGTPCPSRSTVRVELRLLSKSMMIGKALLSGL